MSGEQSGAAAQGASVQQIRTRARRRLIGAAVLAAVAAAVLPLALDREPPAPVQDLEVRLAPRDDTFTSRIVAAPPGEAPSQATAAAGDAAAPAAEPKQDKAPPPAPARPAPPPAKEQPAKAAPAPQGAPAHRADAGEAYVVQLATLTSEANVRQLRQKLSAAGIKSYTEKIRSGNGEATRVRVGPFASREAALRMQDRLKGMGISGAVVPQ